MRDVILQKTPNAMRGTLWGSPGGVVRIPWWDGGVGLGRVFSGAIGTLACMSVSLSVDEAVVCLAG